MTPSFLHNDALAMRGSKATAAAPFRYSALTQRLL